MNSYIDTGISLILLFFIFSVIAYILQEIIAVNLQYRGKVLWQSLSHIFDGVQLGGRNLLTKKVNTSASPNALDLYNHPQIASLRKKAGRLPAYIPAANFSLAVIDIISKKANLNNAQASMVDKVKSGLTSFVGSNGDVFTVIKNLADTSTEINELQKKIEYWYNEYMDRVTGWYKSHILLTTRLIAIAVTLFFNVDVIQLTKEIFKSSELRGKLVAVAEQVTEHPESITKYYTQAFDQQAAVIDATYKTRLDTTTDEAQKAILLKEIFAQKRIAADTFTKKRLEAIDTLSRKLSDAGLPLGWSKLFLTKYFSDSSGESGWAYVWLLLGWLIAAGCISMGAPFWFDLLVKAVNLRRAGIKPTAGDSKRQ